MRLATLAVDGGSRAIVVREDGVVPLDGYADVGALLRDPHGWEAAHAAERNGIADPLDEKRLLRPILAPGAVVCVGLNYRSHIAEMGRELPSHPTLFGKLPRALTDPYADITVPAVSDKLDYEAELAVVIGSGGKDISREDAMSHVAGFTALNDVTVRDFQRRTLQWFAGKTFQASTPVGPWVVTADEFGDPSRRELWLTVNGEERQRGRLDDLVFDVATLVADLSTIVDLEPGDLIATGTPGGVGEASDTFLTAGDVVSVHIDGIGEIRNAVRGAGS